MEALRLGQPQDFNNPEKEKPLPLSETGALNPRSYNFWRLQDRQPETHRYSLDAAARRNKQAVI
jgi:hypothetical protein